MVSLGGQGDVLSYLPCVSAGQQLRWSSAGEEKTEFVLFLQKQGWFCGVAQRLLSLLNVRDSLFPIKDAMLVGWMGSLTFSSKNAPIPVGL